MLLLQQLHGLHDGLDDVLAELGLVNLLWVLSCDQLELILFEGQQLVVEVPQLLLLLLLGVWGVRFVWQSDQLVLDHCTQVNEEVRGLLRQLEGVCSQRLILVAFFCGMLLALLEQNTEVDQLLEQLGLCILHHRLEDIVGHLVWIA